MHETPQIERIRRLLTLLERWIPWLALVAAPIGVFLVLRSQQAAIASVS